MAKIYTGTRLRSLDKNVVTVSDERGTRALNPRTDLFNHSPTGFEWGYSGSGPAQLALAICADCLGDDQRALAVHQDFKARFIAPIDGDNFQFTEQRVRDGIEECRR